MPTTYVAEFTDEDDDEVVVVPYVKPTPPTITLSASEDEDDCQEILKTNVRQTTEKKGSLSRTKAAASERREPNVSSRLSDHSMSKSSASSEPTDKGKASKKSRHKSKEVCELASSSGADCAVNSNSQNGSAKSTPLEHELERFGPTNELSQPVEPSFELLANATDTIGTETQTRSSDFVTDSRKTIDPSLSCSRREGEEPEDFVPLIHISTNIFEQNLTPTATAAKGGNIQAGKGNKRARNSDSGLKSPKKRTSAKSAQEQSRSDLLKFIQHLGLPLEELPPVESPSTRKYAPRKSRTPKTLSPAISALVATSKSPTITQQPVRPQELQAFVSSTDEANLTTAVAGDGTPQQRKTRVSRKKSKNSDELVQTAEDTVFTRKDLDSVSSSIQTNVILPCCSTSTPKLKPSRSKSQPTFGTPLIPIPIAHPEVTIQDQDRVSGTRKTSPTKRRSDKSPAADVAPVARKRKSDAIDTPPAIAETEAQAKKRQKNESRLASGTDSSSSSKTKGNEVCFVLEKRGHAKESSPSQRPKLGETPKKKSVTRTNKHEGLPKKWTNTMKDFYGTVKNSNLETSDILNTQSNSSVKWRTPEDRVSKYRRKSENWIRCDNCHQAGHSRYKCPEKPRPTVCYVCGLEGHNSGQRDRGTCPNAICLNCGASQQRFQDACSSCIYRSKPVECKICQTKGHNDANCPDLWRKYHSTHNPTTNENDISAAAAGPAKGTSTGGPRRKIYKALFNVFCSNCGIKGHNYYICQANRPKSAYYPNKPYVIRHLPPPTIRQSQVPSNPSASSSTITSEVSSQRKVTFEKDSRNSVEMLEIQIENPPSSNQSGAKQKLIDIASPADADNAVDEPFPDAEIKVTINLNPAEHDLLLRAIDENKANNLFESNAEKCVNVELPKDKCEINLVGIEEAVDQARVDIFKLLCELKAAEYVNKPTRRSATLTKAGVQSTTSETETEQSLAKSSESSRLGNNLLTNEEIRQESDNGVVESSRKKHSGVRNETGILMPPSASSAGNIHTSSLPVSLNTSGEEQVSRLSPFCKPSTSTSFQDDELPNMFDVDERFLTGQQKLLPMTSMFQPRGPFSAAPAPLKEYIPIPVPVPVPVSDYASLTSSGLSAQGFAGFDTSFQHNQVFARAYYQTSLEYPQLPQVLPTMFGGSFSNKLIEKQEVRELTPKITSPPLKPGSLVSPPKRSSKSLCETSSSTEPREGSITREESPDLEIIQVVSNPAASNAASTSPELRKLNSVTDTLTVTLLPSEWQLFCEDKTNILNIVSKALKVDLGLDKTELIVTIKGRCKEARKVAQQNILGFLQAEAANVPFIPNLPRIAPARDELDPDDSNFSQSESPERFPESGNQQPLLSNPPESSFRPRDYERRSDRQSNGGRSRGSYYHRNDRNYYDYESRDQNPEFQQNSYRRQPYRPERSNYSNARGSQRYDRNSYSPRRGSATKHQNQDSANYRRHQRYFD